MLREKVLSLVLFLVLGFITFASNPSIAKASPNPVVPNGQLGEFRHGTYPSPPLGDFTHPGVDLAAPCGSGVFALADGTVKDVIDSKSDRNFDSLGYMVIIEHPAQSLPGMDKTFYTLYLHMQDPPRVKLGEQVVGGPDGHTVIGNVGQTGKTIGGCHTHFEVRYFPERFGEWGNIFGPGDKRKSMYFQQFWEDPAALFNKSSQSMAQTPTPEKPLEERVEDVLKDALENKTFSFESALDGVKKEYKRIEALGPEKEAKIQSLLSGFDLVGMGKFKQRAYDSDAKANLHNIYLACKALWADTSSSNSCSLEKASRADYGFSQSSKVSIEIMRGAETNFLAKARHEKGSTIFQINHAGNIESIGSTGIKPEKEIINTADKILALDPDNFWGHSALANAYQEGNLEQGFSHLIKGMHQIPSHPLPYVLLVGYKSDSGDKSLAEKLGQKLKAMGEEAQFFFGPPPDPETLKASADGNRAKILAKSKNFKNRAYNANAKAHLHNIYLACKSLWADTDSSNPCSVEVVSRRDYGFVQSLDVEIKIMNNKESDFLVLAWHKKGEKVFVIDATGNIRESAQKVPQALELKPNNDEATGLRQEIIEKLGIETVQIPGGCFQMGSNAYAWGNDERPVHEVCVNAFAMDKHEVTQAEFEKVMENNPSLFKGSNLPVESVTWHEADAYCGKVGKRLPTEAEWEYAARAGTTTKYYWGNEMDGSYAWYSSNSGRKTHSVGQKKPNAWGLHDMSGNVWEWVADWYDSDYYQSSPRNNPRGPESGTYRVLRGGSWDYNPNYSRSAARFNEPGYRTLDYGFRCVQ